MSEPIITGARYEGFDLPTKYGWMQQGQGANAINGGLHYLRTIAEDLTNINAELGAQLAKLGVSWSGPASVAATGGLTELAGYAGDTHEVTRAGGDRLTDYASSFARLRSAIPKPVDVGEQSWRGAVLDGLMGEALGVFDIQSDYRKRMLHQRELDAQANRALYVHEQSAKAILASFAVASPPPTVVAAGAPGSRPTRAGSRPPGSPGELTGGGELPSGSALSTAGIGSAPSPITDGPWVPGMATVVEQRPTNPAGTTPPPAPPPPAPPPPAPPPPAPPPPAPPPPALPLVPTASAPAEVGVAPTMGAVGRPAAGPSAPTPRMTEPGGQPEQSDQPRRSTGESAGPGRSSPVPRPGGSPADGPIREALVGPKDSGVKPGHGPGSPGVLPGTAGAGRTDEREHRNNHFLPSDEPFVLPVERYRDYSPPVLGQQ